MYARSTSFHGNPHHIDEAIHYVRDKVMPALMGIDGYVGVSMLADRGSGRCIIATSWDDVTALNRSALEMRGMRARAADILEGPPDEHHWKIALLHREHVAPEGARTSVTWARTDPARPDPARTDETVRAFGEKVLPRIADLPGFCSVSVLADSELGHPTAAVTFADRAALDRVAPELEQMQAELHRQAGGEVIEVSAFDLVLAHLRVPETV